MPDIEPHPGAPPSPVRLRLQVCGCRVAIELHQPAATHLIGKVFAPLAIPDHLAAPANRHDPGSSAQTRGEELVIDASPGHAAQGAAPGLGDILFSVDKAITIKLQERRPDLLFVHAAVVSWEGQAMVLAAPSGIGKSTITLALLAEGFGYLSDELAPINLASLEVHPYPRALCLKAMPPAPYCLPDDVLRVGGKIHVPVELLSAEVVRHPIKLAAFFFLAREDNGDAVPVRRITAAAGAARLIANALNPLAHPFQGVDAAIQLAGRVPCFELDIANLPAAVAGVRSTLVDGL